MKFKFTFQVTVDVLDDNGNLMNSQTYNLSNNKENKKEECFPDETLKYGKCKGQKYINVDEEYLKWIVDKSGMDDFEKQRCKKYIEYRKNVNKLDKYENATITTLPKIPTDDNDEDLFDNIPF